MMSKMNKFGNREVLIIIILFLALSQNMAAKGKKKDILFLVPYHSKTQIWQSFTESAKKEFKDSTRYSLHFYYVVTNMNNYFHLNEYARDERQLILNALEEIKEKGINPDMLIIHGDYLSHSAARLDEPILRNTPTICTGVVDPNYGDLLAKRPNVVVMESRPAVKENLDFICALGYPSYVVTVMDSTYVDDCIRRSFLAQVGNDTLHYRPNLFLEQLDRISSPHKRDKRITLFPISIMNPHKNDRHPGTPGGFDLNWIFYTQQQSTSFLHIKNDVYSNVAMNYNIGPYFAMTPEYFNLPLLNPMNSCMGGYFTPFPSMWEQTHPIVDKILSGTAPKNIPWVVLKKEYWLDWRICKRVHNYASEFPEGVNFVNLPLSKKSKTLYWIIRLSVPFIVILFVIYAIILPAVVFVKQKRMHKGLLNKAKEAKRYEQQVVSILSELDSYLWQLYKDGTIEFSDTFYMDFNIPVKAVPLDTVLESTHEPGRSSLKAMLMKDNFDGGADLEVLLDLPGTDSVTAVRIHMICLPAEENGVALKAGFFYFDEKTHYRNEELHKVYSRSEEISEKENFLASVSPELMEPIKNIIGYSRLLAHKFNVLSDQEKVNFGESLMRNNTQLLGLLNEVFDSTKGKSDDDPRSLAPNLVSELLDEVLMNFSISPSVSVQLIPGPSGSRIVVNRYVFIQVVNILISNALNSCKGDIYVGWLEDEGNVVIFIDNADPEIANCRRMVESMGCSVSVGKSGPSGIIRLEMLFKRS